MLAWIPEFTAWCKQNGAPIDFVSSHLYPTDPHGVPAARDNFMTALENATQQAAAAGLPFYLTEYNAGLGPARNGYGLLDSSFAPAFLLHQHLLAQGVPNLVSMSYWTFTDWVRPHARTHALTHAHMHARTNARTHARTHARKQASTPRRRAPDRKSFHPLRTLRDSRSRVSTLSRGRTARPSSA